MKNGITAILCVVLLSLGLATTATAGTVADADSDGVPDVFDNCVNKPNGPLAATGNCNSQEDTDGDGFGNPCDGDLNNTGLTDGVDFTLMFGLLFLPGNAGDLNCSGLTDGVDFTVMFSCLFKPPGGGC